MPYFGDVASAFELGAVRVIGVDGYESSHQVGAEISPTAIPRDDGRTHKEPGETAIAQDSAFLMYLRRHGSESPEPAVSSLLRPLCLRPALTECAFAPNTYQCGAVTQHLKALGMADLSPRIFDVFIFLFGAIYSLHSR